MQQRNLEIEILKRRRKNRRKKFFLKILILTLSFILAGVLLSLPFLKKYQPFIKCLYPKKRKYFGEKSQIKILILGIDQTIKPARTDTIIFTNIDFKNKLVHLISIPRDTLLEIPHTKKKFDKINHAYAIGGIELTKETLEKFLETKIDYYVLTDFEKFKKIIDILGGVEIEVEKRMHYIDRAGNLYIDLYPGKQKLNGEKAMEYVRFRHDALGDIGRIERQQKFLEALVLQCKEKNIIKDLPKIVKEIYNNVETNLTIEQILNIAYLLNDFEETRIAKETIFGKPVNIKGICYWKPDEEKKKDLLTFFLKGIKVEIVNFSGEESKETFVAKKLKEKGFRVIKISKGDKIEGKSFLIVHTKEGEIGVKFLKEIKEFKIPEEKIPENKGIDLTFILGKDLKLKEGG
jgi:LCP family protein required for cell wall assembly